MTDRPANPWLLGTIVASAATLGVVAITLGSLIIDRSPNASAGSANLRHLWPVWGASAASWLALTGLGWCLLARPAKPPRPFWPVVAGVIAFAIVARVFVLFTHTPTLSDDVHRYVFDGQNAAAGVNPYVVVPEERLIAATEGAVPRWPDEFAVAGELNNREMSTIYLPLSQWWFRLVAALTPTQESDPFALAWPMRVAFVLVELCLMLLIAVTVREREGSPWWLALYAWHPLPLTEIAGAGHQDVLGVTFLVAALVAATKRPGRTVLWTVLLALAALVKPIAAPLAALLLRRRPMTAWLTSLAVGLGVVGLVAIPWLGGDATEHLRDSASRFSLKWSHFGMAYEPLLTIIEWLTPTWGNDPQEWIARFVCTVILGVIAITIWWRSRDPWRACASILLAMVLLSPTAHPWYLLWAFALVPAVRHPAVWVASLTLPWGYAVLGDTVDWTVPWWVFVAAYVPVGLALLVPGGVVQRLRDSERCRRPAG